MIKTYQNTVSQRARTVIEQNGGSVQDRQGYWLFPAEYVVVLLPAGTCVNERGYVLPSGAQIYGHYRWDIIMQEPHWWLT